MAKSRVFPAGSDENPNLPVRYFFEPFTDFDCLMSHSVIHSCFIEELNTVSDSNNSVSAMTAFASRCAVATAGPLGPLDSVVNTFDQGCVGFVREPKYHFRLCVNLVKNRLNFLVIVRTLFATCGE